MIDCRLYPRFSLLVAGLEDNEPPLKSMAHGFGQAMCLGIVAMLGAGQKPYSGWGHRSIKCFKDGRE